MSLEHIAFEPRNSRTSFTRLNSRPLSQMQGNLFRSNRDSFHALPQSRRWTDGRSQISVIEALMPVAHRAARNAYKGQTRGTPPTRVEDRPHIIFLLQQPGGRIAGNYVHSLSRLIYPDDGSAGWTITRNVSDPIFYGKWLFVWTDRIHDLKITDNFITGTNAVDKGTNNCAPMDTHLVQKPFSGAGKENYSIRRLGGKLSGYCRPALTNAPLTSDDEGNDLRCHLAYKASQFSLEDDSAKWRQG